MNDFLDEVLKNLEYGSYENLNLEFKSTFDYSDNIWAKERLIRSILAMSNTEGGGKIIIGLDEKSDRKVEKTGK